MSTKQNSENGKSPTRLFVWLLVSRAIMENVLLPMLVCATAIRMSNAFFDMKPKKELVFDALGGFAISATLVGLIWRLASISEPGHKETLTKQGKVGAIGTICFLLAVYTCYCLAPGPSDSGATEVIARVGWVLAFTLTALAANLFLFFLAIPINPLFIKKPKD